MSIHFSSLTAHSLYEQARVRELARADIEKTKITAVAISVKERVMLVAKALLLTIGFLFSHNIVYFIYSRTACLEAFKQGFTGIRFKLLEVPLRHGSEEKKVEETPKVDGSQSPRSRSSRAGSPVQTTGQRAEAALEGVDGDLGLEDQEDGEASEVSSQASRHSSVEGALDLDAPLVTGQKTTGRVLEDLDDTETALIGVSSSAVAARYPSVTMTAQQAQCLFTDFTRRSPTFATWVDLPVMAYVLMPNCLGSVALLGLIGGGKRPMVPMVGASPFPFSPSLLTSSAATPSAHTQIQEVRDDQRDPASLGSLVAVSTPSFNSMRRLTMGSLIASRALDQTHEVHNHTVSEAGYRVQEE
jgi:hypothetical protein